MKEPFVDRQVNKILEKTRFPEKSLPAPVYNPTQSKFEVEVVKWRKRLFPIGAVMGVFLTNAVVHAIAPEFYNPGNAYYIGTLTLLGAGLGIAVSEGGAYWLADVSGAI